MSFHLAVDLGAESGRIILGRVSDDTIELEEIHRFPNGPVEYENSLRWDIDFIWDEIIKGISMAARHNRNIQTIGVDAWGVDYVLLGTEGQRLGLPYHYRDSRTGHITALVHDLVPRDELYHLTGIQTLALNTIFQLAAFREQQPEAFSRIFRLLYIPDYINYRLTGRAFNEYTIASTSQMMDMRTGQYSEELLKRLGLPIHIFPPTIQPAEKIGRLLPEIQKQCGCGPIEVVSSASHDTACAVAGTPASPESRWAFLSSGTWSLIGVERGNVLINDETNRWQITNEGGVSNTIRLLKNLMGLWPLQECRRTWEEQGHFYSYPDLTKAAAEARPFAGFIDIQDSIFLKPGNMEERIKKYLNNTGQPSDFDHGQIARIILEGLAFRYSEVLSRLETVIGDKLDVLHIVGGGSQNDLLNQMTADAAGRTVMAGPAEAAVCGNIIVQIMAQKKELTLEKARQMIAGSFEIKTFSPGSRSCWKEAGKKYQSIRDKA